MPDAGATQPQNRLTDLGVWQGLPMEEGLSEPGFERQIGIAGLPAQGTPGKISCDLIFKKAILRAYYASTGE